MYGRNHKLKIIRPEAETIERKREQNIYSPQNFVCQIEKRKTKNCSLGLEKNEFLTVDL